MSTNKDNVITLSTGVIIELCYIPSELRNIVDKRHPLPEPPIVETVAATGNTIRMIIEDDPEYLAECDRVQALRDETWKDAYSLAALKNVKVPDGFDIEEQWGEELRYLYPDWEPRIGKTGRKLDYIAYELLASAQDSNLVAETINKMMGIDMEEVDSTEDSF